MKTPLRFQVTEYDCGTTSLLNAFSFLFDRNEIPAELVHEINVYTLDCQDDKGTSREAINKITKWITKYANEKEFNVKCERLEKNDITLNKIKDCLNKNGCVFIRCWQLQEHYVIITKIKNNHAYIFDSYYLDKNEYKKNKNVKIVLNKLFDYNRKVTLKRLFSESKLDFSLGPIDGRECVLINKIKKQDN